jgi:hypothetical protein
MSVVDEVYRLSPEQVKVLCTVMIEASLAKELDGSWKEIIRRAKFRKVGRQRKILEAIETLNDKQFDNVSKSLAETENE